MPAPLADGNIVKVVTCCYTDEQIGLNTTYWKISGVIGTGIDTAVFANGMDLLMAPLYKLAITAQAKWRGVGVQRFRPIPVTLLDASVVNEGVGTGGADAAPTQASMVISFYATLARRSHRGRIYIPFPALSQVDPDGSPKGGIVSAVTDISIAYNAQQTFDDGAGNSVNADCCIWQHRQPEDTGEPAVVAEEFNLVSRTKIQDRFGTQRRRSQYGAHNQLPF